MGEMGAAAYHYTFQALDVEMIGRSFKFGQVGGG